LKVALYGLPCAGKTTLLSKLSGVRVINGSQELNRLCKGNFSKLPESEKNIVRVKYTKYLNSLKDEIILSDGHYSFLDNVVFNDSDAWVYDVFLYLYCEPQTLLARYKLSEKNNRYSLLSLARIDAWQKFEIEHLRSECHYRQKDFYVLSGLEFSCAKLTDFIAEIAGGFSSYHLAEELVSKIRTIYPQPCKLHIADGDKTIIKQDSFKLCSNYTTTVFDGDFYTGYQSMQFAKEIKDISYNYEKISSIEVNKLVFKQICDKNYIVLSSGVSELWQKISSQFKINYVFADPLISADTKYFVVKLLQMFGYTVSAYGDSKNDLYMLKAADIGYLCIGTRMSRSLKMANTSGIKLLYERTHDILTDSCYEKIAEDITVCKSNSGINGGQLAQVHLRLGQLLGTIIGNMIPSTNAAVIVLERGGRFFGDGLYSTFGGTLYPFNPSKEELPYIDKDIVIIVDSVINTGNSILKIISKLLNKNPLIEVIIAANVIQRNALSKFSRFKLYAVRISDNSFIGKNQAIQHGNSGPDTADRLFNFISQL